MPRIIIDLYTKMSKYVVTWYTGKHVTIKNGPQCIRGGGGSFKLPWCFLVTALWNIGYQKEENVGSPFGIFGSFL